jgi:antirestriction protein
MNIKEEQMKTTPCIFVVCMTTYAESKIYSEYEGYGEWIDCNQSAEKIFEEIQQMIDYSPSNSPEAGEWEIHDYDGWEGYEVKPNDSIENLANLAKQILNY